MLNHTGNKLCFYCKPQGPRAEFSVLLIPFLPRVQLVTQAQPNLFSLCSEGSSSPAEIHSLWKIITGAAVSINPPNCSPVCVIAGCFPGKIIGVLGWGGGWSLRGTEVGPVLFMSDLTGWSCSQHCTDPSWDLHKAEDKGEIILPGFQKEAGWKKADSEPDNGGEVQTIRTFQASRASSQVTSGTFRAFPLLFSARVNFWVFRNISCVREFSASCDTAPHYLAGDQCSVW